MNRTVSICGAAGALLLLVAPGPRPLNAVEIRGTCDVRFRGSATLHDFQGTGRCAPFAAPLARGESGGRRLPVVSVRIPVASLDTGNARRDAQMRRMFGDDRYPEIRGTARDVDAEGLLAAARENPGGTVALPLSLAIRGVEKAETASVSNVREAGERVLFDLDLVVSLSAYELKPPTVLGLIRVADTVRVRGTFALDLPPGE